MCWNIEVSLAAAVYGYSVSIYLHQRGYTSRDAWYGLFLATFTSTQAMDAIFWWIKENQIGNELTLGDFDELPCTPLNWYMSKFVVPLVVFFQPIAISVFPSSHLPKTRPWYRLLAVLGAMLPIIFTNCTTLYETTGLWKGKTLMYGGVMPSYLLMSLGILFWSVGAIAYCAPFWVGRNILLIGGLNLVLLLVIDGTIRLVSKLCFYCLLLSIMWLVEPYFVHPDEDACQDGWVVIGEAEKRGTASTKAIEASS
eukprot:m.458869 g.458869  ORF g.458869 m.458869 type:complete len:254 (+) comp21609_c0_seq1:66-827(+)